MPVTEEETLIPEESAIEETPTEMAQFVADETDKEKATMHEESSGVWSPDMVEKRVEKEAKSAVEMIEKLGEMKEKGLISDEEFESSKRRLLKKI
jgi:hypothetical protein